MDLWSLEWISFRDRDGTPQGIATNEVMHSHPYREYYIAIEGEAELQVGHDHVKLAPGSVAMVEPGEEHMVSSVATDGAFWIVVKERSEPGTKMISSTDNGNGSKS